MIENNLKEMWNNCLQVIKDNVPEKSFNTWFAPIEPIKYENNTLFIQVPTHFFYEMLDGPFLNILRLALEKGIGKDTQLQYKVMVVKEAESTIEVKGSGRSTNVPVRPIQDGNKTPNPMKAIAPQDLDSHLIPNYTFSNFIKGTSNELSRTVGETVAKDPAKTFNPLFLHGPSGVGKTHLTNAIGTRIKELYPEKRVLYLSAHLFQVQDHQPSIRMELRVFRGMPSLLPSFQL